MLRRLVLIIFCVALLRCADHDYNIAVRNLTPVEIADAYVRFEGFQSVSGYVPPGVHKVTLNVGLPVPETATVEWREPDGTFYRRVVEVRKLVPPRFDGGEIFFEILPQGQVRVIARTDRPSLRPQSDDETGGP